MKYKNKKIKHQRKKRIDYAERAATTAIVMMI